VKRKIIYFLNLEITVIFLMFISSDLINNKIMAQQGNLVKNPSFEIGWSAIGQEYNQNGWTFFVIEQPATGVVLKDAKDGSFCFEIQTKNGLGFLHSEPFPIKPLSKLNVSLWVKGDGEGAIEILWWNKYDENVVVESEHHRDILKTFNVSRSWQKINTIANAPKDANFAYIRLVAKKANVSFDGISVNP
jgi:hypothetical protein